MHTTKDCLGYTLSNGKPATVHVSIIANSTFHGLFSPCNTFEIRMLLGVQGLSQSLLSVRGPLDMANAARVTLLQCLSRKTT